MNQDYLEQPFGMIIWFCLCGNTPGFSTGAMGHSLGESQAEATALLCIAKKDTNSVLFSVREI